jgi:recombination protein RecT
VDKIEDFIEKLRPRIIACLQPGIDPIRYLAALSEYFRSNQNLFQCDAVSLERSIIDAAFLGLELGPPFDLAAIVAYKDRKSNGPPLANLIIEYRGHMIQVYRTGRIRSIAARPVYEKDIFDFQFGRQPVLTHRPTNEPDRGGLVHAYAVVHFVDGGSAIEVINRHDAAKAMADSPGADRPGSLWKTRSAEMWTKTAIKKLINRMPRAPAVGGRKARGDPPPRFAELLKAVSVSPELYQTALTDLDLAYPSDTGSIAAVLAHMRTLYKLKHDADSKKDPSN